MPHHNMIFFLVKQFLKNLKFKKILGQHIGAHGTGMGQKSTYSWNFPFWRIFKS